MTARPHQFGGREFRVGRRELGHLHELPSEERIADLPFPRRVRDALLAEGRAVRHHWLPASGWVSMPIRGPEDVAALVALLRLNYERPWLRDHAPDRGGEGRGVETGRFCNARRTSRKRVARLTVRRRPSLADG